MTPEQNIQQNIQQSEENNKNLRKPYRKPQLKKLGDLRTLTLGVSGAPTDFSGGGPNEKPIGL